MMIKLKLTVNKPILMVLVGLCSVFQMAQASANECLSALPDNTIEDGPLKVCQSDFSGVKLDYACQDYHTGEQRFRVLYQGGVTPKAVLQLDPRHQNQFVTLTKAEKKVACPLPAPAGIPSHATHKGTGLCLDNSDHTVPCSVYEHAGAREVHAYRYLVLFNTDHQGQQNTLIHAQVANENRDAMVAELAYQIGMSLRHTECCSDQATDYLAYAHQLFPHARIYREAYQLSLDTNHKGTRLIQASID